MTQLTQDYLKPIGEFQLPTERKASAMMSSSVVVTTRLDLVSIDVESRLGIVIGRWLTGHGEPDHRAGQCGQG